jgi:hypothetical protein
LSAETCDLRPDNLSAPRAIRTWNWSVNESRCLRCRHAPNPAVRQATTTAVRPAHNKFADVIGDLPHATGRMPPQAAEIKAVHHE